MRLIHLSTVIHRVRFGACGALVSEVPAVTPHQIDIHEGRPANARWIHGLHDVGVTPLHED
jgi:hypothetical protein